ncbi:acetate--CoA ligase family protein, partial [Streptomyces sp. NPDC059604]|uniref:acetate--CoA ligase family protein n=1 Tax=Streptomyces sp. NPDC059604 TaxID=3346881 RepID=UPI00369892EB
RGSRPPRAGAAPPRPTTRSPPPRAGARTRAAAAPPHRSIGEIGEPVDLAVVAVPADRVPEAVEDCGEHGVQGLVVLSAGYAEWGAEGRERQRELVRQARSYGMRIIGPNAFGLINNAETVRLNASLAPEPPAPGRIGLFTQSGAIGIALLSGLYRRGAGLSTFISAGNRADISGNDFLQYWYEDPNTDVALLYLESIGNPRKFTRLARRTAAVKPVVVVKGARHSGSTPPGHAVPVSRIPDATVSALMRQAGVIRVDTVTEMVDAGLLLADQPLPAGPRVAILGNSESLGLLTYDACLAEGLRPRPPLDLTTAATPQDFRDALSRALADEGCDSVIVTAIPWVGEDGEAEAGDGEVLAAALHTAAAAGPAKPVAVVHVEIGGLAEALSAATSTVTQPGTETGPPGPGAAPTPTPAAAPEPAAAPAGPDRGDDSAPGTGPGRIPAYPAAERAVRALAEAVRYAQWRRQAALPGKVPEFLDDTIDGPGAAGLIDTFLGPEPDPRGRSLTHAEARELLGRYGITVRPTLPAPDPDAAVAAAARLGYPVALKTTAPHLRHRADLGGVRLDLANEAALRRAYGELTDLLGKPVELQPVVQAMAPRGVDTVVRATIDPAAGAVLSFGLAGAPSELLGDTAHRLVPATDRDAAELIRSIRAAPVLFGWRGAAPVDTASLEELLLRVSRLVDDHPEVVSVALEPVVVATQGLTVLGASVRLSPPPARTDLGPRRLPNY